MDSNILSNVYEHLKGQAENLRDLSRKLFSPLSRVALESSLNVDAIHDFTKSSMNARLPDHRYYVCTICLKLFEGRTLLRKHKTDHFNIELYAGDRELAESRQKIFICKVCDVPYMDLRAMIVHLVSELLVNGFTIPTENLDLSQCITIVYVEQLYYPKLDDVLENLREALEKSDEIFDDIDRLIDSIDREDSSRFSEVFIADEQPSSSSVKNIAQSATMIISDSE